LLKQTSGFLFIFDITNKESFEGVKKWLDFAGKYGDAEAPRMLIGNKGDQEIIRKVTKDDATTFANENEMDYMEVSSKDNMQVTKMFEKVLDLTYTFYLKTGK
jgi:GTPase SAR1 family protein